MAASRASRAWRGETRRNDLIGALASPGVRTVLLVAAGHGLIVRVVQVSAAARFTADAGLLYAALSAGSVLGAVASGTRLQNGHPGGRLAGLTVVAAAALSAAATATTPVVFAGALFVLGTCLGPAGVLGFALAGRLAPPGHTVESFTMVTAAGLSAIAVGAAAAGAAADRSGSTGALAAAALSAVLLAFLLMARRRSLAAAPDRSPGPQSKAA
jgi:MFS family permease